jgi:hypothetical protein
MEPHILLAAIRALLDQPPDFDAYAPTSRIHNDWLARAYTLVARWDQSEAWGFESSSDRLELVTFRNSSVAQIFRCLSRAVADLELRIPPADRDQAFGPGAVYDAHRALSVTLRSADKYLFIVDPYLNSDIFDAYLSEVTPGISVNLLCKQYVASVKVAALQFRTQHGLAVDIRSSKDVHDRVIFVDDVCWVLGQSVKDMAATTPTYLAPLSPDVSTLKLGFYRAIWASAAPV